LGVVAPKKNKQLKDAKKSGNYKGKNTNHIPRCVNSAVTLFLFVTAKVNYIKRRTLNCINRVEVSVMFIMRIWLTLHFLWPLERYFFKSPEVHLTHSSLLYVDQKSSRKGCRATKSSKILFRRWGKAATLHTSGNGFRARVAV
jgi:hypothetical protein